MVDRRIRALERTDPFDPEASPRLLAEHIRAGRLDERRVRRAAALGAPTALALFPEEPLLKRFGFEAQLREVVSWYGGGPSRAIHVVAFRRCRPWFTALPEDSRRRLAVHFDLVEQALTGYATRRFTPEDFEVSTEENPIEGETDWVKHVRNLGFLAASNAQGCFGEEQAFYTLGHLLHAMMARVFTEEVEHVLAQRLGALGIRVGERGFTRWVDVTSQVSSSAYSALQVIAQGEIRASETHAAQLGKRALNAALRAQAREPHQESRMQAEIALQQALRHPRQDSICCYRFSKLDLSASLGALCAEVALEQRPAEEALRSALQSLREREKVEQSLEFVRQIGREWLLTPSSTAGGRS